MVVSSKADYKPLLGPGRHRLREADLYELFVKDFSAHRVSIHFALLEFFSELRRLSVRGQVWVDGSFVCEKKEPSDVDVVVIVWHEEFDILPEESKIFLDEIQNGGGKFSGLVDAFVCIEYPRDHPFYELDNPEEYVRLYGSEHNGQWLKGFAVVEVGPVP